MEAQEKRRYIITKCYKLLLLKGFDGVSISDIQKECGVSRGLLYHYFGSKEDLFYEVVSKVTLPKFYISSDETCGMNLREALTYIYDKYYKICINDELKGISLLNFDFLTYRATQESKIIRTQYEEVQSQELKVLKIAIDESVMNGDMIIDVNHRELAIFTSSLISGIWMNSLYEGDIDVLFKRLEDVLTLHLTLLKHK